MKSIIGRKQSWSLTITTCQLHKVVFTWVALCFIGYAGLGFGSRGNNLQVNVSSRFKDMTQQQALKWDELRRQARYFFF